MKHLIVSDDPNETTDIAESNISVVEMMLTRLLTYILKMIPADNPEKNKKGHSKHFKGIVSPGWCEAK